jgi:hypothetical protein
MLYYFGTITSIRLTDFGRFQHHHCKHHSPQVSGDIFLYNQRNLYEIFSQFKAGDQDDHVC